MAGSGAASTEVEASSFSIWNCVITFLQILLISTMLYGTSWNHGQMYNVPPDTIMRFQHFRAIAFFFCVWALQSVALALLLVWAIGKKSYNLCHSWLLCEALMQIFIILSSVYFAYRSTLFAGPSPSSSVSESNEEVAIERQHHVSIRLPKHLIFLIILHFLIKSFGFWIVWKYMKLIKTCNVQVLLTGALENSSTNPGGLALASCSRQVSPPPSYAYLCKDDLPCYDEAVRLSINNDCSPRTEGNNHDPSSDSRIRDKSELVQV